MSDQTSPNSEDGIGRMSSSDTPPSMTLSDFMGWTKGDLKRTNSTGDLEDLKDKDEKVLNKLGTPKKNYYLDKLEYLNAIRSPIARH